MKNKPVSRFVITAISASVLLGVALAAQDRYTLTVPDGLAFAEFKGYDTWQDVSVSETASSVKAIVANPIMIKAFQEGAPGNGKPFPEGSKIVTIGGIKTKNSISPYFVEIPDYLNAVDLIENDTKRFRHPNGWACSQFTYETI